MYIHYHNTVKYKDNFEKTPYPTIIIHKKVTIYQEFCINITLLSYHRKLFYYAHNLDETNVETLKDNDMTLTQ